MSEDGPKIVELRANCDDQGRTYAERDGFIQHFWCENGLASPPPDESA